MLSSSAGTGGSGTPEAYFPLEADQEHYLNVMTNFSRWRTPSPCELSKTSSGVATPNSCTNSSDSLTLGPPLPLFRDDPEGSSSSLPSPEDLSSGSIPTPDDSSSNCLAKKVKNSIENLDMMSRFKRHHIKNSKPPLIKISSEQSQDDFEFEPLVPELIKDTKADQNSGTGVKSPEQDDNSSEKLLVLSLDTSKAATLTRACKFGGHFRKIPDGGQVTVGELREMATRQQHQIETQQQLLVAREQRLKYLKQQEGRSAHINMEAERLRRLKERVEAQEAKLRRLRALRGQVDSSRVNAASLSSDLDAMRHLFSEKEKELVDAVSKVEELTRQLEDIKQGRTSSGTIQNGLSSSNAGNNHLHKHHQELDKLRRELLYRNSVNREASSRVASQRDALANRKEDISRIDTRIAELQQRLHRKRLLNQQLVSQISAATQAKQAQLKAVQQRTLRDKKDNSVDNAALDEHHRTLEDLTQFDRGKHDPKYQTLPYNTKFSSGTKGGPRGPFDYGGEGHDHQFNDATTHHHTMQNSGHHGTYSSNQGPPPNHQGTYSSNQGPPPNHSASSSSSSVVNGSVGVAPPPPPPPNHHMTSNSGGAAVMTRTVHSIPTHLPSKGHASAPIVSSSSLVRAQVNNIATRSASVIPHQSNSYHPEELTKSASQSSIPQPSNSNNQDVRPHLPPTSLSMSFSQLNPGVTQQMQPNRPSTSNKDVENVRAIGFPAGSMINSSGIQTKQHSPQDGGDGGVPSGNDPNGAKLKPLLPPKPAVPSKPTPPPRQKGDPMVSSTESINMTGVTTHRTAQSNRPQVFRYASQNVILSTYTQQQQGSSGSQPSTKDSKTSDNSSNKGGPMMAKETSSKDSGEVKVSINRRIGLPSDLQFHPDEAGTPDTKPDEEKKLDSVDTTDRVNNNNNNVDIVATTESNNNHKEIDLANDNNAIVGTKSEDISSNAVVDVSKPNEIEPTSNKTNETGGNVVRRLKKGNLKMTATNYGAARMGPGTRRVSFDPLALLLDASLEGELELVQRTAQEVSNPSAANDEGITALHNAICAGHLDIVTFLVTFGCDVNAQDSDGWTPLHCAASCNNVAMVRFLVEHGACVLAMTLSDHETAAEKCEQDEEGYDGCSQYLYNVQEKLGIMNSGTVYAVYDYNGQNDDELSLTTNEALSVVRRGDEYEREWWWVNSDDRSGYVPRNLLGLYPRVKNGSKST